MKAPAPTSEPFILRPATQADQNQIRKLVWKAGINPSGLKWPHFVVAATPRGEVVACGQVKPHADGTQELASIAVKPSWQRRGLARAIIERLLASHSGELYLMCRSSLGPMYEKFGFQAVGPDQMPRYFQRVRRLVALAEVWLPEGETLLVMRRAGGDPV